ncbi:MULTISPECIES: hypothetical protein [Acinetobacter calcoaceticus/baumannii complex]|uniref:Uncharacterized protein n=2 Tax=Acinetobacter nosocomialis TaxID=106654 RepID=A0A837AG44_ACINO|nr:MULTISPECIES: hypothetical protein [Acinetobacter calcoaceticus/baumannii complex]EKF47131.1 hypothetical protein W9I_00407 [Acinetobacter nosocomialis Ab22222]KDM58429.1 hypothetical protein AE32_00433 [Acinetobacter nosocomialis]KQE34694.1 hypothetical protein APD42_05260 [Acinetobacter nosocomialis]KRJ11987.1 hypothetical protein APC77_08065 [Acinetobacter nosocomialis]MBR7772674.1 hypothetical protein [Acinetobacter nosocomialis]
MNISNLCRITLLSVMSIYLNGCATQPRQSVDLQEYLKGFLGKSSTTIQQELNLRSLGFQIAHVPQKTSNQLIYTILRPLSIPIPMVSNVEMGGNPVPIQSGTLGSNSYDVNFNCKVIFQLKNDIAESIQYEGKAC